MEQRWKRAGSLFAQICLCVLFGIYPFYMKNGYSSLGEDKYRFLLITLSAGIFFCLIAAVLVLICRIFQMKKGKRAYLIDVSKVSAVDLCFLLFTAEAFVSFAYSGYRSEAFYGTDGWHMGFLLLLLLFLLYILIRFFHAFDVRLLYVAVTASAIVFFLAVCNRFSVYPQSLPPFLIEAADSTFLSTIGNINWLCGYLSVMAPIGMLFYLVRDGRSDAIGSHAIKGDAAGDGASGSGVTRHTEKIRHALLAIYVYLVFLCACSQGSSSVFLFLTGELSFLWWIGADYAERKARFFQILMLAGLALLSIFVLWEIFPSAYNYDTDNLCGYVTGTWVFGALLLLLGGMGYLAMRSAHIHRKGNGKWLSYVFPCALVLYVLLLAANTMAGIPFLQGNETLSAWFTFDENWGNGRGASIMAGIAIFGGQNWFHKLFGVGPDCFYAGTYEINGLQEFLYENFGGARLTNAHCEPVTILVNQGILGVLFFGLLLAVIIRNGICRQKNCRNGKQHMLCLVPAVCAVGYLVHNLVSFSQVLNLPFLLLLATLQGFELCGEINNPCKHDTTS